MPKQPVVLCHGVASSGKYFDLNTNTSMVDYLVEQNYHVYNLNLRGVGGSFCKKYYPDSNDFNFEQLLSDVSPIVEFILDHYKQYSPKSNKLHWVGHSLGALLMYAFLSQNKNHKGLIESFVALSSPTELRYVGQPVLLGLLKYKRLLRFHLKMRKLAHYFSYLITFINTKYHNIILNHYAVDRKTIWKYLKEGLGDIAPSLLKQLTDWIINETMCSTNNDTSYDDMGKNIKTPILLMSGSYDTFCPPHALLKTYLDIPLPHKKKEMVILSKISGFSFDYCHVGIVMGKKVKEEVFPLIGEWLERFE